MDRFFFGRSVRRFQDQRVHSIMRLRLLAAVGIAGLSLAILAGLFFSAKTYLDRRADRLLSTEYRNRVVKPDGFVKYAYRSWKEKFCLSINFVDTSK